MIWHHVLWARFTGKNLPSAPKELILNQLHEPRPLPMGVKEFEEWSDRLISGALVPGCTKESQKATLAGLVMQLGPTESHKPDAHFIHSLRKLAVNQVCLERFKKYQEAAKMQAAMTPEDQLAIIKG